MHYKHTYIHIYRSTPQNRTQGNEHEETERVKGEVELDVKDKAVSLRELSDMDTYEEFCSEKDSSLETDLAQLLQ